MQPLANKYPKKGDIEKEELFPMQVFFCPQCKNVQLGTIIPRDRMFEDYYYLSSVNQGLVRHFERFAEQLKSARFVVDIGSNDGILLKPLKALGIKALGVEPSINVSKIANDADLPTINAFFDADTVEKIIAGHGKADVVVASSVFTHLEDPHTFIEDVKKLLSEDGRFIIEVENIGHILDTVQFERFYLDRIFYYSLTSLKHLFEQHGMRIIDVEKVELHGISLRVTADCHGMSPSSRAADLLNEEENEITEKRFDAYKDAVAKETAAFKTLLKNYKASGLSVAGYGAPARVATITNYADIGSELIDFLVDDSPLKQNRFSPGKHIPIVPKTHLDGLAKKPDVLVVFAYEYFDDIRKKTGGNYRYVFPIPPKEVS